MKSRQALLGWLACASVALSGGIAVASTVPGQLVDVQLNGPAKSSTSQAINSVLHEGE